MQFLSKYKEQQDTLVKLLPFFAFAAPVALLFLLNPTDPYLQLTVQDSFQLMWKGRTFELFFIWLILLEFILGWETFKLEINKQNRTKIAAVAIASVLPTVYVVAEYYLGLNGALANFFTANNVAFSDSMPLAIEYLVFSAMFCLTIFLYYGKKGLTGFALPALFAALVGVLYTIDNMFPYGQFTPFQILVPTTAGLAAYFLRLMGCTTILGMENGMPTLQATGPVGTAKFAIAWPCAGIESFLIFVAVCVLFLQQMQISWKAKVGYFIFGAAVTYFINVFRIVTIFTIGMQYGVNSSQVQIFHFYYGPLYAIAWIVSYPLIIFVSQELWHKNKKHQVQPTLGNLNQHS